MNERQAKPPKPTKKDWIDCGQRDIAACLGVSNAAVAAWAAKGMPGSKGRYRVPDVVAWLLSSGPWSGKQRPPGETDPLLSDGDSPGLERYRLAKAALAELELEQRTGSLISRDEARSYLSRWAAVLRRLGERLGRRYGNEAAAALNDALEECDSILTHDFDSNTNHAQPDSQQHAAN